MLIASSLSIEYGIGLTQVSMFSIILNVKSNMLSFLLCRLFEVGLRVIECLLAGFLGQFH